MMKPLVSILIPARNEEDNLPHLFQSLDGLQYSKETYEIILGNDQSHDKTGELMDAYASQRPNVKVFHVSEEESILKGKTRVLDLLASEAQGEYLFFTDADMELPPYWISGLLKHFQGNTGVVVGVTTVKRDTFWGLMQGMEWLMALTLFYLVSLLRIPVTGMGNNMAVSRRAYDAIGGYKKIGFSIVEDYLLYSQIIKSGFGFVQAFEADVLAWTKPAENYWKQRKRWLKGAIENAPKTVFWGFLQAISLPLFIVLGIYSSSTFILVFSLLLLFHFFIILFYQKKLKLRGFVTYLPLFFIYLSVAWLLQFLYYLFQRETHWKDRKY
ncbi:glycosyltransferase [Leadbetterella byssophila]|uniref:glycosyltransferase n=1 Tax=Leadbetterella byssophila TaxID=316068 RepID=UPI00399FF89F